MSMKSLGNTLERLISTLLDLIVASAIRRTALHDPQIALSDIFLFTAFHISSRKSS
jgi:hypothetical protein